MYNNELQSTPKRKQDAFQTNQTNYWEKVPRKKLGKPKISQAKVPSKININKIRKRKTTNKNSSEKETLQTPHSKQLSNNNWELLRFLCNRVEDQQNSTPSRTASSSYSPHPHPPINISNSNQSNIITSSTFAITTVDNIDLFPYRKYSNSPSISPALSPFDINVKPIDTQVLYFMYFYIAYDFISVFKDINN